MRAIRAEKRNQMRKVSFRARLFQACGRLVPGQVRRHPCAVHGEPLRGKAAAWLRNSGKGWVTAEYGMLPRSTGERMRREATAGKQGGRTQEIQRLIGRSLRAVVDLEGAGRTPDHRRLRCDPGRWRHPHGRRSPAAGSRCTIA